MVVDGRRLVHDQKEEAELLLAEGGRRACSRGRAGTCFLRACAGARPAQLLEAVFPPTLSNKVVCAVSCVIIVLFYVFVQYHVHVLPCALLHGVHEALLLRRGREPLLAAPAGAQALRLLLRGRQPLPMLASFISQARLRAHHTKLVILWVTFPRIYSDRT